MPAPEEERAPRLLEEFGGLLDPASQQLEGRLDLLRRPPEVAAELEQRFLRHDPANAGELQGQQVEDGDLGDEGLGAATQISGPALVSRTASASRVMSEPRVLVTASTLAPKARAVSTAASVSVVSPLWLMATTSVFSSPTGSE